jgi:HEPN domain-containing protein
VNNLDAARRGLDRASLILEEALHLRSRGAWKLVVRRCQESVEIALKAALIWAGLDVPRVHDVGPVLQQHRERFPAHFQAMIGRLASISRALRAEREISFYGDEQSGVPPEALYTTEDADEAIGRAQTVLEACRKLVDVDGP